LVGEKTTKALRRLAEKALLDAKGDVRMAMVLVHTRLRTGSARNVALREAIISDVVCSTIGDIILESPEKARDGLLDMPIVS
jgi:hypothetical protein